MCEEKKEEKKNENENSSFLVLEKWVSPFWSGHTMDYNAAVKKNDSWFSQVPCVVNLFCLFLNILTYTGIFPPRAYFLTEKFKGKIQCIQYSCYCLITQSYLTFCDPMDCSLLGSSVHGILQVRRLEWVAVPSDRGSSRPGDRTRISCIGRRVLYH